MKIKKYSVLHEIWYPPLRHCESKSEVFRISKYLWRL